jgi:hypothetical protein
MVLQVALALQGPGYQTLGLVVSHTGKKHMPHFQALFLVAWIVAWICIKLLDSSNVRIVTRDFTKLHSGISQKVKSGFVTTLNFWYISVIFTTSHPGGNRSTSAKTQRQRGHASAIGPWPG